MLFQSKFLNRTNKQKSMEIILIFIATGDHDNYYLDFPQVWSDVGKKLFKLNKTTVKIDTLLNVLQVIFAKATAVGPIDIITYLFCGIYNKLICHCWGHLAI